MIKINSNKKKIADYSLVAVGILAISQSSKSEVVYTDVDPDKNLQMNADTFFLDLNKDTIVDYLFTFSQIPATATTGYFYRMVNLYPQGINEIINTAGNNFPKTLDKGNSINRSSNWVNNDFVMASAYRAYFDPFYKIPIGAEGPWPNKHDGYLGLRIYLGGDTLYGWARLDVDTLVGSATIKDFAYESISGKGIKMGLPINSISNLTLDDIGDAMNGSDLKISFDRALDETNIEKYEIFVVKSSDADTFDIDATSAVSDSNKITIIKTGSDISIILNADSKDINGDLIHNDQGYKIFVLSKTISGSGLYYNTLSEPSSEIILKSVFADVVTNVMVSDISNNADGRDIEIVFTKAADESTIDEYRIIVIKAEDSLTFNLEMANIVAPGKYTVISKQGIDISTSLSSSAKDKDGDIITENQSYVIYVLSVADGINAGLNSLSEPSNTILLSSPTGIIKNHAFMDAIIIANTKNGLSVQMPQEINLSKGGFIRIIDLSGRVIQQIPLENHKTFIDMNAQTGQYIVEVHTNDAVHNRMIQHFDK